MIYLYRIGPQLDHINMLWRERIDACTDALPSQQRIHESLVARRRTTPAYLRRHYGIRRLRALVALATKNPGELAQMGRAWEARNAD